MNETFKIPLSTAKTILVTGGAYSGKSHVGASYLDPELPAVMIFAASKPPYHPGIRGLKPPLESPNFRKKSAGLDLTAALIEEMPLEKQIIVDSINQWIGRLVVEEGSRGKSHVISRLDEFIMQLQQTYGDLKIKGNEPKLIFITSEAGLCPPPASDHERFFRQMVGLTNQVLCGFCEATVIVECGTPRRIA